MGKSTKPRLYITPRMRIITIAFAVVTVVGIAKLKFTLDDHNAGSLTPEQMAQIKAHNQKILNIGQKTSDAIHRPLPPGAIWDGKIRKAKDADTGLTVDVERYQTADGQCRIAFRLMQQAINPRDIISLKVNNTEVPQERIPGSSRDLSTPCPVGKADARLTTRTGNGPAIIYVLPAL
jgi:hypothetical protein